MTTTILIGSDPDAAGGSGAAATGRAETVEAQMGRRFQKTVSRTLQHNIYEGLAHDIYSQMLRQYMNWTALPQIVINIVSAAPGTVALASLTNSEFLGVLISQILLNVIAAVLVGLQKNFGFAEKAAIHEAIKEEFFKAADVEATLVRDLVEDENGDWYNLEGQPLVGALLSSRTKTLQDVEQRLHGAPKDPVPESVVNRLQPYVARMQKEGFKDRNELKMFPTVLGLKSYLLDAPDPLGCISVVCDAQQCCQVGPSCFMPSLQLEDHPCALLCCGIPAFFVMQPKSSAKNTAPPKDSSTDPQASRRSGADGASSAGPPSTAPPGSSAAAPSTTPPASNAAAASTTPPASNPAAASTTPPASNAAAASTTPPASNAAAASTTPPASNAAAASTTPPASNAAAASTTPPASNAAAASTTPPASNAAAPTTAPPASHAAAASTTPPASSAAAASTTPPASSAAPPFTDSPASSAAAAPIATALPASAATTGSAASTPSRPPGSPEPQPVAEGVEGSGLGGSQWESGEAGHLDSFTVVTVDITNEWQQPARFRPRLYNSRPIAEADEDDGQDAIAGGGQGSSREVRSAAPAPAAASQIKLVLDGSGNVLDGPAVGAPQAPGVPGVQDNVVGVDISKAFMKHLRSTLSRYLFTAMLHELYSQRLKQHLNLIIIPLIFLNAFSAVLSSGSLASIQNLSDGLRQGLSVATTVINIVAAVLVAVQKFFSLAEKGALHDAIKQAYFSAASDVGCLTAEVKRLPNKKTLVDANGRDLPAKQVSEALQKLADLEKKLEGAPNEPVPEGVARQLQPYVLSQLDKSQRQEQDKYLRDFPPMLGLRSSFLSVPARNGLCTVACDGNVKWQCGACCGPVQHKFVENGCELLCCGGRCMACAKAPRPSQQQQETRDVQFTCKWLSTPHYNRVRWIATHNKLEVLSAPVAAV